MAHDANEVRSRKERGLACCPHSHPACPRRLGPGYEASAPISLSRSQQLPMASIMSRKVTATIQPKAPSSSWCQKAQATQSVIPYAASGDAKRRSPARPLQCGSGSFVLMRRISRSKRPMPYTPTKTRAITSVRRESSGI